MISIQQMLLRKQDLDAHNTSANQMVSYTRWQADAIELLLHVVLDLQQAVNELDQAKPPSDEG
jgi:hypothetical protein